MRMPLVHAPCENGSASGIVVSDQLIVTLCLIQTSSDSNVAETLSFHAVLFVGINILVSTVHSLVKTASETDLGTAVELSNARSVATFST